MPNGEDKAKHGCEVPFVFGKSFSDSKEVQLSDQMVHFWQAMAGSGDPNGNINQNATAAWPAFSPSNPATMVFGDSGGKAVEKYRFDRCNFWDKQFEKFLPTQDGEVVV